MDSSRRAVESYWRSRMIDGATTDEDKVTPVYKLEEICELLRSSHGSIVREVSEFILKRLDHKSPIVKQKALRLIKYAVGKSGAEFRREMQRNSAAVRQLFHYKGQPDPLKGDALNKAVRDSATEAISAIFSTDDNKPAPAEDLNKRIQGFGNTNFEMPSEDKKSFLSEVVGIGSATLKQGFTSLTQAQSQGKNDTGSYRSPNLRRSLTTEIDYPDRYDQIEHGNEAQSGSRFSRDANTGSWGQELRVNQTEMTNGNASSSNNKNKSREERLLETIVTSGGVRLQPTRDALQAFLVEASKFDELALSHALESKLGSPLWQVRMKAVCVLEAILKKKDIEHFAIVASYFSENKDVVIKCTESPQASLREKSNKVLSLLDGERTGSVMSHPEKPIQAETPVVQMPDLIDTGGPNDSNSREDFLKMQGDQEIVNQKTSTAPIFDDLFGDSLGTCTAASEQKIDDDPFADVSFHANDEKDQITDIFSGLSVDKPAGEVHVAANGSGPKPFDIFGPTFEIPKQEQGPKKDISHLVAGLLINKNSLMMEPKETSPGASSETIFPEPTMNPNPQPYNGVWNGLIGTQAMGMNVNSMFPLGPMGYNVPPGYMVNPGFSSQPVNYGAMGNLFAQQQLLATVSNFQQMANLQSQDASVNHAGLTKGEAHSSPLPDIFNPAVPTQIPMTMMNTSRKEETKAFDFISDHLAAARDPKRVV
ncbi:protein MODIFIED TRANSPORT TO THE VACUOLE 1 isoform X2 [Diospyros lotus]|uniref:protein MODIFIED TRANSPORT TO THE VACUOLE 1 isoform X1 n=1 Tax=Diospyros lotus TaxID=55363 RepID=UPI0022500D10|nr:protein MODIFIED TRANSPORT TO THE VACUOLE 1 isoform X1 [Diospyros lotus]XP_052182293.1 protein MODIFIED TRANSPORT TO THE VACUOLE 1 isoform X1 [Diospyros lotus]XP_052182294.1 protein MODIFIED TRANSPORT TO THE VACUOLE 1 isoform X2 [Diospyros lotus]